MNNDFVYCKLKSEPDRFGFSNLIKKKIKPNFFFNNIYCTWVHAWKWFDITDLELLGLNSYANTVNAVVANEDQYIFLKKKNFKNVFIGGLPYIYVDINKPLRKKNSLIAILPKSKGFLPLRKNLLSFLDYIKDIEKNFEDVCICIFGGDIHNTEILNKIKKYKLQYTIGAIPNEINSLERVKYLFSQYEYCVFNSIGSHVVYSALSGCRIGFGGIYDERDDNFFINNKLWDQSKKIRDLMIYYDSLVYVKKKFPKLFENDVVNFKKHEVWAKNECGIKHKLNINQIKDIFGWSLKGKIKGIVNSIMWRID